VLCSFNELHVRETGILHVGFKVYGGVKYFSFQLIKFYRVYLLHSIKLRTMDMVIGFADLITFEELGFEFSKTCCVGQYSSLPLSRKLAMQVS